ncbi:carbamoyl phosphate synthase small subunit [Desmospora profundinema]|uniref:Carbamoyl phosphate synthase small chain n=1 Tax=Desmospora profundinema TaxID=1571184 RepID=A0ABU1ILD6_9BACL|nr:carbamoyl phosphate synthase small subunit [Desmospora profundinema]MDR6225583.1 carbamoyl-phosphate synthase small subunit [Desmospora profundinema]
MEAYLVFDDGDVFPGEWIGVPREHAGEVVFTTGMTGYQEVVTDPSYAGQLVTFTYPLIGNYGVVADESESEGPRCAGVVVNELYGKGESSLSAWLARWEIPGIAGVDTRAIARKIRDGGARMGLLSSDPNQMRQQWPDPASLEWVKAMAVSRPAVYPGPDGAPHIVLVDFGTKRSIVHALIQAGCRVTVVPFHWSADAIADLQPDGLLFSNGPGDPKALTPYLSSWVPLVERIPTMGICLGHQLLALALGADTERLPFGHRGSNHPVRDLESGRVWITSQNHGYTVRASSVDPGQWRITHEHVNDGSVEGLAHRHYPLFTVQFHPEAHPGPREASALFNRFIDAVVAGMGVTACG